MQKVLDEAELKADLMAAIGGWEGAHAFRLEDKFRSGLPDICVSAGGITTWHEAKVLRPGDRLPAVKRAQILECAKLNAKGSGARFLVWDQRDPEAPRTLLVPPQEMWAAVVVIRDWHIIAGATSIEAISGISGSATLGLVRGFHERRIRELFSRGAVA